MTNFRSPRSDFWISFLVLLAVAVSIVACKLVAAPTGTERPNMVLILADDLGYGSLGCYGSTAVKTPNIDALAADGMRFTDFHSNGALCTPTRAALLTGRYQQRAAWVDDALLSPEFREQRAANLKQRWAWGLALDELTVADVLRSAGYRTALFGKWHQGYDHRFHPMEQGFDEFRGFIGGAVDYHTHVGHHGLKELDWWKDRKIHNEPGYTTDLLAGYAVDFIRRQGDAGQPFFCYITHGAPHGPWQGRDPDSTRPEVEIYREIIEVLDESVGRVRDAVRERGLEANTLFIFCSDNGPDAPKDFPSPNGPLQGKKGKLLEGGHREPCLAVWPGVIPAGTVCDETVMMMDLLPTFAALAGVENAIPEEREIDGVNLLPLLKGEKTELSDRVLHWEQGGLWAVREGPWKLMGKEEEAQTLVNLDEDLGETTNLLAEKPELAEKLHTLHRAWAEDVGMGEPPK